MYVVTNNATNKSSQTILTFIYLKPSYFSGTLNLAIFVGKDLVYFYFNDFTEIW